VSNLEFWNSVKGTDPNYTRFVEYGGRKFTAIDPYWRILKATELWGPYGSKWGLKDQEIKVVNELVIYKATFFCPISEFTIYNDIKFGREFAKKVETDTLTKAMSKLGFSADVFMGQFDDSRYVDEQKTRYRTEEKKAILIYTMDKYKESIEAIKTALAENDLSTAAECYIEIGMNDVENHDVKPLNIAPTVCQKKFGIEGPFTTREREIMKSDEFFQHMRDFLGDQK
jgi:hypothetical protein